MGARPGAAVYLLWAEPGGRPDSLHRSDHTIRILRGIIRNYGRREHSQSSGGDADGCPLWFPVRVSALRFDISSREHSGQLAMAVQLHLGQILHRDRARCVASGGRMACDLVQGSDHRRDRPDLFPVSLARHETNATEVVNNIWV